MELLLKRYGIDAYTLETEAAPSDIFSEGLVYKLPGGGKHLAVLGTVNPSLAKKFDIKQAVFAAEINWPVLLQLISRGKVQFSELPKFPGVRRDLAVVLDENVTYADIQKSARRAGKKLLKQITLFDVYRGEKLPAGKKQYALGFFFQDPEKTLTDAEIEKVMGKILATLQNEYGAALR